MEAAEHVLRVALESNKETNDEELKISRQISELKRQSKALKSEMDALKAKLKSVMEKVRFTLYNLKNTSQYVHINKIRFSFIGFRLLNFDSTDLIGWLK